MYLSFYGLKIKPFQNSANPRFCWLGESHIDALAILKYGILEMPGFFLLTGDVGTGKTTLVNVLINRLGSNFIVVKVPDPGLDEIDFINYLSDTLDFKKKFTSKDTFITHFSQFLDEASSIGKKILLVIDECQRLSSHLLDEIIKLSNIETVGKKALKVLFIGQNDFNDVVQKNKNSALAGLVSIKYALAPLDLAGTGAFVEHRLKIAGAKKTIFSPDAITKIYQFSAGIPRRINIICDHALLSGYRQRAKIINGTLITGCAEDLCPPDFSTDRNKDSLNLNLLVSDDCKWQLPESRKKAGSSWVRKAFVTAVLIALPLFLILIFTDQTGSRDVIDYIKTQGIQIYSTLRGEEGQEPRTFATTDGEEISSQGNVIKASNPVSSELISIEDSRELSDKKSAAIEDVVAKEGVVSVVAPLQEGETDAGPESTINSSSTNDILANDTVGTVAIDDLRVEPEITQVKHAADSVAHDEIKEGSTDLLDKQVARKLNAVSEDDVNQKVKIDFLDALAKPEKSEATREILEDDTENVDPGAVIDWVIKNHSK